MLYCEECRIKNKWRMPATYPYHAGEHGRCESCRKHKNCYNVPALFLKEPETAEEKLLDKGIQEAYKEKCADMVVCFTQGRLAGHLNHRLTEAMQKVFVNKGDNIDWYSTYQLRLRLQEGYRKDEEIKSRRTI